METINKKIPVWFLILVFLSILLVSLCLWKTRNDSAWTSDTQADDIQYVKIAGKTLRVEVADTSAERAKGLSGRTGLKEEEGMLFVFPSLGRHAFWMKEMNFAIDIVWLGGDKQVVYVKENVLPESYPETFSPPEDAKYVLEAVSGFSARNNLKIGDAVEFSGL